LLLLLLLLFSASLLR